MPSFSEDWLRNISKALSIFMKHFDPPRSDYERPITTACTNTKLGQFMIPSILEFLYDLVILARSENIWVLNFNVEMSGHST